MFLNPLSAVRMTTRFSSFCMLLLVLLTGACRQPASPSGHVWFFTHSSGNTSEKETLLTPANFIDLEKDGSFTSDFGQFDYGTWVYTDGQLLLTGQHNRKSILPVVYLTAKEMQVGPAKGPLDNFESQPGRFASAAENPFSKENNAWRIKPAARETEAALKKRIINHCRFWEMYFSWAFNNTIQYIDVRSTPTPIKIYGNGFGLIPLEELPAAWKSYFYDEEDCAVANRLLKKVFDSKSIAWPHTENKYKMFISAFQQMQQLLQ